ncbi:MAG: aldolase/citrate lyase family protein [Thermodesulfobacteriota bacterium]|nr:aldolase/citrate lyase family protein [Thermodesulfobacteriota bacterium]
MELKENCVKKTLKAGKVCIGSMVSSYRSPQIAQIFAVSGWDYLIMDTEHSFFDYGSLADIFTVARTEEIVPLVRVTVATYPFLARALDVGAMGVICPHVETPEEVRHIVDSCLYAPLGQRGLSMSTIHLAHRRTTQKEYVEWANANTLIVIQPETGKAIENIENLVSIPGVDAVMIGPHDLSLSLGIVGQLQHPRMVEAYERVIAACRKFGVAPGIHLTELEQAKEWLAKGMRFFTFQNDLRMLIDGGKVSTTQLRQFIQTSS